MMPAWNLKDPLGLRKLKKVEGSGWTWQGNRRTLRDDLLGPEVLLCDGHGGFLLPLTSGSSWNAAVQWESGSRGGSTSQLSRFGGDRSDQTPIEYWKLGRSQRWSEQRNATWSDLPRYERWRCQVFLMAPKWELTWACSCSSSSFISGQPGTTLSCLTGYGKFTLWRESTLSCRVSPSNGETYRPYYPDRQEFVETTWR